jgi:phage terminase large subunit GpA-like protein
VLVVFFCFKYIKHVADGLLSRREEFGNFLPDGIAVLTAGVDIQDDRLEIEVVGWGKDEESWSVDFRGLWGDLSSPNLWKDLDTLLSMAFPHCRQVSSLPILKVAVDTGGLPQP